MPTHTSKKLHRVAMVLASPFPAPRGTQAWVSELCAALTDLGHEVHLFCYGRGLGGEVPQGVILHRAPLLPGVPADLGSAPTPARPVNDLALLAKLLVELPRLGPTVIHGHNHEGGIAAGIAGRLLGIPVVHQIHGALAEELVAWTSEHGASGGLIAKAAGALGWTLDHAVPRLAHRVLTLDADSPSTAGYSLAEVTVLPPGVTQTGDGFPADAPRLPTDEPWAAYPGNLDPYQSLPLLLEAWPMVTRAVPKARLAFVTHDAVPHSLGSLPGARVIRTGSAPEAASLVASARLVVIPRTGGGGYPLKMLNALGAAVPVVACRPAAKGLGPSSGVLPVDVTPEALAEGLVAVLTDVGLREELAQGARSFSASHSWRSVAEVVAGAYDSVTGRAGARMPPRPDS